MSKTFNVYTVEETCHCVFGGQNTELPVIEEKPLNPDVPVVPELKEPRKATQQLQTTTPTPTVEITDTDTIILTLLNEVSQVNIVIDNCFSL